MADQNEEHVPTDTEIINAVQRIRKSQPALGRRKMLALLKSKYCWSLRESRLKELIPSVNIMEELGILPVAHTLNAVDKATLPPLLAVLSFAEVRQGILGPFLTINISEEKYFDPLRTGYSFPGLKLLRVCRQMRKTAWSFLIDSNIWMRAEFSWALNDAFAQIPSFFPTRGRHLSPLLAQPMFQPNMYSPDMLDQFNKSIAVSLHFGKYQGSARKIRAGGQQLTVGMVFAFHPHRYGYLINNIAATVKHWQCLTVTANYVAILKNPDIVPRIFPLINDQILYGLENVRGAELVVFHQELPRPDCIRPKLNFDALAKVMMIPITTAAQIQGLLLKYYKLGVRYMDDGDYSNAMRNFSQGKDSHAHYLQAMQEILKLRVGHVESNDIWHVKTEVNLGFVDATNRLVSEMRRLSPSGGAGPGVLLDQMMGTMLDDAIQEGGNAMEWLGITDVQRFHCHYLRAVAFANKGDFLVELHATKPSMTWDTQFLQGTRLEWYHPAVCYREAARDAFYATKVCLSIVGEASRQYHDSAADLHQRMWAKTGGALDFQRGNLWPIMIHYRLPVIGDWYGDRRLAEAWGTQKMLALALFQQRSGAPWARAGGDLTARLAEEGLSFMHHVDGKLYLRVHSSSKWAEGNSWYQVPPKGDLVGNHSQVLFDL